MSNGSDNRSGKPPAPPGGPPRVAPAVPTITASPAAAPVVQRPATVPIVASPSQAGFPAGPGVRPASPAQPGFPAGPGVRPAAPAAAAPAQPGFPAGPGVRPAQPGYPGGPGVRPAAPVPAVPPRPAVVPPVAPAVAPARAAAVAPAVAPRPGSGTSPALVPPVAPAVARGPVAAPAVLSPPAQRPGSGTAAVLVPPVAPARPATAAAPPGYPTGRPISSPSGLQMPPPPPSGRPVTGPSAVIAPPAPAAAPAAQPAPARKGPLPETGAIEGITAQQAAALKLMAVGIDGLDYFQALGVAPQASPGEIKKAFYRESRTYHPDRFFHLPDSEVKVHLGSIYKRLTEAYFVLRDDVKRKKYLSDINGPDRANKLRYTEATEFELKAEARKAVEEEFGNHPKARPLFKAALADIEKESWTSAERNLKSGLMYDPSNARFKEKLVEVQKKAEEARKASSSGYLIK